MQPDRRRVQTAVSGAAHSDEPVFLSTDSDEATEFRDRSEEEGRTYWCGTLLGGCGGRLSLKVPSERKTVPHFAHRADSNLCARLAHGGEQAWGSQSADHLYAHHHLRRWLGRNRPDSAKPEYVGLGPGRPCTELIVPLTDTNALRIVLSSDPDLELLEVARSPIARDYVWLVRKNDALKSLTHALFANRVPYRWIRLIDEPGQGRLIEIDLPDSTGETHWTPLSRCVLRGGTLQEAPADTVPPSQNNEFQVSLDAPVSLLEQAIRSLHHVLDKGEPRGTIMNMAETVRRQLRAARARKQLTADLAVEANAVLEKADKATRLDTPAPEKPRRKTHVAPLGVPVVERNRQRAQQRQQRNRQIAEWVDHLVSELTLAKKYRRNRAYEAYRAQLVEVFDSPETPPRLVERIKGHLRKFPKDLFPPRGQKVETEPQRHRKQKKGHRKESDQSAKQGRREERPSEPAPPPRFGLEVQATIDDRSRRILEEIRSSTRRPVPRTPPPERW